MNCRVRARSLALSLGALGAVLAASCSSLPTEEQVNRDLYGNFQTAVASDRNYDIYWLGREFEAVGQTFQGPWVSGPDQIGQIEGGGLSMSYSADESRGEWGSLDVTLYSRPAWDRIEDSRSRGAQARFEVKQVDVHGWLVELKTNFDRPDKVGARILVVDLGRTVIEVTTGSVVSMTPGPEPNPLIDEATFLSVMQNLRPYPQ